MEIEERIIALEAAFAEVKKLKGIPGDRGPAGRIDAAVANAREAMAEDLAATLKKCTELQRTVEAFDGKLDARILKSIKDSAAQLQEKLNSFQKNMEDEVTGVVIKVLQDYRILDSECRVLDANQRPAKSSSSEGISS